MRLLVLNFFFAWELSSLYCSNKMKKTNPAYAWMLSLVGSSFFDELVVIPWWAWSLFTNHDL